MNYCRCCMPEICWVATCIVKLLNLVEMDDCLSLNTLLLSLPFHFFLFFLLVFHVYWQIKSDYIAW